MSSRLMGFTSFSSFRRKAFFDSTVYDTSGKVAYHFRKKVPTPAQILRWRNAHVLRKLWGLTAERT